MADTALIELVNRRLGNTDDFLDVSIDREDLEMLITAAISDMRDSGVPQSMLPEGPDDTSYDNQVATAIFCHVAAYFGTDRTLTNRYLTLYRNYTFRLTLNEEDG